MKSEWFYEERKIKDPNERNKEKKEIEKVLKNSTIFQQRLERILNAWLEATYKQDEDFENPRWQRAVIANASRRKTLREIINLIDIT